MNVLLIKKVFSSTGKYEVWRKKLKMSTTSHVLFGRTLKKHADNLRRLSGTKPHSIEKHGVARHQE